MALVEDEERSQGACGGNWELGLAELTDTGADVSMIRRTAGPAAHAEGLLQ